MNLNNACEALYGLLSASSELSGADIIKAYPYADKPTRMQKTVIAVKPVSAQTEAVSIGSGEQYGEFVICADVFTPHKNGVQELTNYADKTVKAALALSPSAVSVSSTKSSDSLNCLYCRCSFTLKGYISNEE